MPNIKKVIIPTITILLFHITAFAQITLNMNKVTVKAAMEKLKNDYGYSFVFESGDVNTRKSISVRLQNKSISETAEQILQGQEVTHEIRDNNIIVRKKSALPNPSATQQNPKIPVTGTVIDASGEPVVGANIAEKGTTNGTSTDANGKFTLNVESGGTLIISYIGYASQDIKIVDNKPLTITMTEDTQALDEVVVTALGIKRQAKALSYAAAEIKGDKIIPGAEVNVMNALAGKVAGVNISTTGTGIAGSSRVVIRGNTTINGDSNPLYVIDGIQVNRASVSAGSRDLGDIMNTINMNDIETVSILKGAAATALYGSQAANGVVLITTKSGRQAAGKSLGVTYNGSFGIEEYVNPLRNRQTTYGVGLNAQKPDLNNGWMYETHREWGAKYDGSEAYYPDNTTRIPWGYSYHESHWDEFMREAMFANNSIGLVGGTEKQNYRLSVSDMRQQSPIPNSDMDRQTMDLNTSTDIGKVHIDAKLEYSTMRAKNRQIWNTYERSLIYSLASMPSMWDVNWLKGTTSKLGAKEDGRMLAWSTNEYYNNPWWSCYQNEIKDQRDRMNGLISGRWNITPWLYATGRVGVDVNVVKATVVESYGATVWSQGTGNVEEFTNKEVRWTSDYSVVFNKEISRFNIYAMFGGSSTQSTYNRDGVSGSQLQIPFYHVVTNASVLGANVGYSKSGINSLYGNAEFSYDNFIYLNVTGRNDWFSSLTPDNNSLFYPSVGLSYIFSQNLKLPSWISFGKLRASYAQVGGGAGAYMTKFGYGFNAIGYAGYPLLSLPGSIPKSDLKPYQTREYEGGIDLRLFDNRIAIDYAYYDKLTKNDIVGVSLPYTTGYTGATVNLGSISNKGHEIVLTVVPVRTRNINWDITMTYTHNTSEVLDLGGVSELSIGNNIKQIVGEPINTIVGFKQAVDEASGKPVWYWNASRGVWFPQQTTEPVILGIGTHPNMGGLSTSFSYKDFTLGAMIEAKWGAKVWQNLESELINRGHAVRTAEFRDTGIPVDGVYKNDAGVYVPLDHDTTIPYTGANFENFYRYGMNTLLTDYSLFDASFVKMRQITVGYAIPKSLLNKTFIQSANVSLVGHNLFDIVNHLPNGDASTSGNVGYDIYNYPSIRSYSLNINLSF